MKKNMGTTDRVLRIIIAVIFYVLYATETVPGAAGFVLFAIALVFLVTSLFSFCPLYRLFGINTCKVRKTQ